MSTHTIYYPFPITPQHAGQLIQIEGDEARHAMQVKRVHLGDPVRLLDGAGTVTDGCIVAEPVDSSASTGRKRERTLHVRIETVTSAPRVSPVLDVYASTPKGQHVDELIDGLCQIGAASWSPLHTARSIVDPRPTKLERLDRVALEAMKQCGRAWRLRIESTCTFAESIGDADVSLAERPGVILADASGAAYKPSRASHLRLLIGPEGGWTPAELEAASDAGVQVASFGPHVMRIETAAVVAAGIILAAERGG